MDKILKIQTEIGVLSKDQENPFFKSKYLDINGLLAQLLPLLAKHGLTVIQPINPDIHGEPSLDTVIYEGDKQVIHSSFRLPKLEDPQKMGSAITYYRRYALQSLFLLQAQDDDGNHASIQTSKPVSKTTSTSKQSQEDYKNNVDPFI